MKVAIFSCLHGHNFREFSELTEEGINSRLLNQAVLLGSFRSWCVKNKVDVVLNLGDVYHLKNNLDTQVIKFISHELNNIGDSLGMYIVPGNHDYRMWNRDHALLDVVSYLSTKERVHILSKGWKKICQQGNLLKTFFKVYVSPYTRQVAGLNEEIAKLETNSEEDIFLAHQDIIGAVYGSGGFTVERGLDPEVLSKKFKFSFIGHCHDQFVVNKNVINVGAIMQHNFSDAEKVRGWWVYDSDKQTVEPIPHSFTPVFFDIKHLDQKLPGKFDTDFYRITLNGSQVPDDVKKLKWKRLSFNIENKLKDRVPIKMEDSDEDIIQKYVEAKATGFDNKKLIEMGRKYL